MTLDWILAVGTLVFALTTWATLNFGYGLFRTWGERDDPTAVPPALTPEGSTSDPRPPVVAATDNAGAARRRLGDAGYAEAFEHGRQRPPATTSAHAVRTS